jgi:hypothetical protein
MIFEDAPESDSGGKDRAGRAKPSEKRQLARAG